MKPSERRDHIGGAFRVHPVRMNSRSVEISTRSQVKHQFRVEFRHGPGKSCAIEDIDFLPYWVVLGVPGRHCVDIYYLIAARAIELDQIRSDKPGTSCDQDTRHVGQAGAIPTKVADLARPRRWDRM